MLPGDFIDAKVQGGGYIALNRGGSGSRSAPRVFGFRPLTLAPEWLGWRSWLAAIFRVQYKSIPIEVLNMANCHLVSPFAS